MTAPDQRCTNLGSKSRSAAPPAGVVSF